ncbi:MAG: PhoH family protein [Peptococcaceae bacterium]|nr:PhoH family protein [Peptococcaceae bacterium]
MRDITEQIVLDETVAPRIFGPADAYLRLIVSNLLCDVVARGNVLTLSGSEESVSAGRALFAHLIALARERELEQGDVNYALTQAARQLTAGEVQGLNEVLMVTPRGKQIRPKTQGQKEYLQMIRQKTITFGIGPAGTGKTYLAVVMAVQALKRREVDRIILTRPAVEAGEKLGFLPGDLQEKIDPYLRPLYDGLFDTLGQETAQRHLEKGVIEIAPLAYMRGRTLDDAFIILDEAQNTTSEQMKMFLTRIGFGSKAVVTGDLTQIDLPRASHSGLRQAYHILQDIEEIGFYELKAEDVVRHPVVAKIIRAYDRFQQREMSSNAHRNQQERDTKNQDPLAPAE